MSWRRKRSVGVRSSRSIWQPEEDDKPQTLLSLLGPKSSRGRKKKMPPRKITSRRSAARSPSQSVSSEVIPLDDSLECPEIVDSVNSRINTFMQTGSFTSSDDDETEMIKTKCKKKSSPSQIFACDDSDDEHKTTQMSTTLNFDVSRPGTSTDPSDSSKDKSKSKNLDEDIMGFVDNFFLHNTSTDKEKDEKDSLNDMKSLEDYRKETEEMLKNASTLLEEIKTGRKAEPPPQTEESPTKVTIGACPICLESLANRQASVTVCGHIFCKDCILETALTLKKCPTCRKGINAKKIHPIYF